jgi:putative phosphoribosyl transferase
MPGTRESNEQTIEIRAGSVSLEGAMVVPAGAQGIVLFAHGSGSSRQSPRNRAVARALQEAGLATLLVDLLSAEEEVAERYTRHLRFDIPLLAGRLVAATEWLARQPQTTALRVGYFGASTGAGAALLAAGERRDIAAVVSRGGRPDLAGPALAHVGAPTLLIVGGNDLPIIDLNRHALARIHAERALEIIPGATHLFEEPGALEEVTRLARNWFLRYLGGPAA